MGNRMCGGPCRRAVEERLTRPQRLLRRPSDVDYKKLRKLIVSRKLAPCFDALDEPHYVADLEECPICFFYFPSLNRSACCSKGICTECFLQMKPSDGTYPAQCPFCKNPCYAVEYRGARTEEEKYLEQTEEQKVIEAKVRMQCESQTVVQVIQNGSHVEVPYQFSDLRRGEAGVYDYEIHGDSPLQLATAGMGSWMWILRKSWSWKLYGNLFRISQLLKKCY